MFGARLVELDDLTAVDAEGRGTERIFAGARPTEHRKQHLFDR